jgi:hypothetical protein
LGSARVMVDEDFKQTVLDYFGIEAQRHRDIMAQSSDILTKIAGIDNKLDALKASLEKALAGASETIPAGHAQVLDSFIPHLDDLDKKITAIDAEMTARVGVLPVPGQGPSPGVV